MLFGVGEGSDDNVTPLVAGDSLSESISMTVGLLNFFRFCLCGTSPRIEVAVASAEPNLDGEFKRSETHSWRFRFRCFGTLSTVKAPPNGLTGVGELLFDGDREVLITLLSFLMALETNMTAVFTKSRILRSTLLVCGLGSLHEGSWEAYLDLSAG